MNEKGIESLNNFNILLGNCEIAEEGLGLKLLGGAVAVFIAACAIDTGKRKINEIKDKKRGNFNGKRDYDKIVSSLNDIKKHLNELPNTITVSKSYYEKILKYKKDNESKFKEVVELLSATIKKYSHLNGQINKFAFKTVDKDRDKKIIEKLNKIRDEVSDDKYKEQYAKFKELSSYSKDSVTVKEKKYMTTVYREKKEDTTNDFSMDKEKITISKSQLISLIPIDEYLKISKECRKYYSAAFYGDGDDWWERFEDVLNAYGLMSSGADWNKDNSCPLLAYAKTINNIVYYIEGLEEFATSYIKHIISILKHCYY